MRKSKVRLPVPHPPPTIELLAAVEWVGLRRALYLSSAFHGQKDGVVRRSVICTD